MSLTDTEKGELKNAVEHLDISILGDNKEKPDEESADDQTVSQVDEIDDEANEQVDDVDEPTAEQTDEPTGESTDDTQKETDWGLVEEAVRAGVSLEDAVNWPGGEDSLRMHVSQCRRVKEYEKTARLQDNEQQDDKPKDILDDFPELSEDEYDAETVKAFNGIRTIIKKQQEEIAELKKSQDDVSSSHRAANEAEVTRWFDSRVESMDEDSKVLLGAGGYNELNKQSKEFKRREAIAQQIVILANGYSASNIETPPRDELYDTAAAIVLANDLQDVSSKKLSEKLQKRSKVHIQRAGGTKQTKNMSVTQSAAEKLKERFPNIDSGS